VRLDDPQVVREQYATEDGLLARRALYADAEGPDARDVVFAAVAEVAPRRVLEVGCGPGELAERISRELDADVAALDVSPRMVELTRARGVAAQVGDVQSLPFGDGSFDCAVAAWMLFHVPDLDRGLSELARVLRPGGRLVAATNGDAHLRELWDLLGGGHFSLTFRSENGEAALRRHFAQVERHDVQGWVTFEGADAVRRHLASTIRAKQYAERVPSFDGPLRARRFSSVFVAGPA
jgi:SAM-dependent methyltransferase